MRKKFVWRRVLRWLVVFGCVIGCAASQQPTADDVRAEEVSKADRDVEALFRSQTGTRWFGVYEDDIKIGWAKEVKNISTPLLSSRKTFHILKKQEIQLLINGYVHEVIYQLELWFETKPPFALERYAYTERINDAAIEKQIVRDNASYQRIVVQDGQNLARPVHGITYTLADELALELWLREAPKEGDFIQTNRIDPDDLRQQGGFAKIRLVGYQIENSRRTKTYHIEHPEKGQGEYQSVYRDDLTLVSQTMGSNTQLRNQPEAEARAPIPEEDLYVRFMLPIGEPIGRSDAVKRVALSIDSQTGILLTDSTGQSIEEDQAQGSYRITLDTTGSFRETASSYEIQRNLEVDPALRTGDDPILDEARAAINGTDDPREKVLRLLAFVDDTIEDSNEVISPNLKYVLEKRKGDCSEHAILFEALARFFEIPCRKVSGLAYMGDWAQSFGMHAWNEIVQDGYWQPVDSTIRAYDLPPFYIRFPMNRAMYDKLANRVPKMKIKVLNVEKYIAGG